MSVNLKKYGWRDSFERVFKEQKGKLPNTFPGRVISVHRTSYEVISEKGIVLAEIDGNRLKDKDVFSKPVVGDWVLIFAIENSKDKYLIEYIFPRYGVLKRERVRERDTQIIASNVDLVLIVFAIDQSINFSLLDRMLIQLLQDNLPCVLVFNKTDLMEHKDEEQNIREKITHDIPLVFTSTKTKEGIQTLKKFFKEQETIAIIGASGVGKSSLANLLSLEENSQKVGLVNMLTKKGRHTTTSRRLILAKNGSLVIDMPGIRSFALRKEDYKEDIDKLFFRVESFAQYCKFRNCHHKNEPGCAVKKAIEEGKLDIKILEQYQKTKEKLRK